MGGQLILIRHGIAEERTPEGDDFYRKLTEAGVEEMTAFLPDVAPLLTEAGNLKIWTSPLVRARQTAELVAEGRCCRSNPTAGIFGDRRLRGL